MHVQGRFAMHSMRDVRRLVQGYGWAILVTGASGPLQAAHIPCLLDPEHDPGGDAEPLVVIGHTARADPVAAALRAREEVLLVFQGPHGYVSPAWYGEGTYVPTWNFTAVHVSGTPDVLAGEDGFAVLERTVEHFESARDEPWQLSGDVLVHARKIARGTVPFRLRSTRVVAKAKLSQDKPHAVQERVVTALETPGRYQNPVLAAEMRRVARRGRS